MTRRRRAGESCDVSGELGDFPEERGRCAALQCEPEPSTDHPQHAQSSLGDALDGGARRLLPIGVVPQAECWGVDRDCAGRLSPLRRDTVVGRACTRCGALAGTGRGNVRIRRVPMVGSRGLRGCHLGEFPCPALPTLRAALGRVAHHVVLECSGCDAATRCTRHDGGSRSAGPCTDRMRCAHDRAGNRLRDPCSSHINGRAVGSSARGSRPRTHRSSLGARAVVGQRRRVVSRTSIPAPGARRRFAAATVPGGSPWWWRALPACRLPVRRVSTRRRGIRSARSRVRSGPTARCPTAQPAAAPRIDGAGVHHGGCHRRTGVRSRDGAPSPASRRGLTPSSGRIV